MQLVRCGTRKLETDLCQNAQNVIAGTRLAFCHQETDFLIIYNESDVILFSRQKQGLIKKQIHTMNLPKNISFPMMIYQSNILFCMCLSDNNECAARHGASNVWVLGGGDAVKEGITVWRIKV